jgi:arylsulfatase A-like enzyme
MRPINLIRRWLLCLASVAMAQISFAADELPQPEPPLKGKIAVSVKHSTPERTQPVRAPQGAPNIVLILLDDVGFGASSTFGGPAQTPELDKLAAEGLRYNRFHVSAVCSATRAALLTGRNDHRVGFGNFVEAARNLPGYDGIWKKDAVSVAEVLRRNGYSTASFGKWHNTPVWETTPIGPFDRWPTGLGFEYFYGFMGGADSQWEPTLYRDTLPVEPFKTPAEGYHFTIDIVDDAVDWIHTHESLAPEKPYFLYLAPGATHGPHHVPKMWIDKYRGQFNNGWDTLREEIFARQKKFGIIPSNADLTPRPRELPAWDSLPPNEKRWLSRQMEVFAGFLSHTDHEVGRLLDAVRQSPHADNTIVLYIVGDNGADANGELELGGGLNRLHFMDDLNNPPTDWLRDIDELGSPRYLNNYASGWAWATNTPFQWAKHVASHFGGTRDPLVVAWPARIKDRGEMRSQFTHVTDIAATLYEIAGVRFPNVVDGVRQIPLDGASFEYTFDAPLAPSHHRLQVFEQDGNRAIYRNGWMAVARHTVPWLPVTNEDFVHDKWELYNLEDDFSQAHDIATRYPGKLRDLEKLFNIEAQSNNIFPLSSRYVYAPGISANKKKFAYFPDFPRTRSDTAPDFSQSHRITAEVLIPEVGAEGVIITDGSRYSGFALYIKKGRLIYEEVGARRHVITSAASVPSGHVILGYEFVRDNAQTGIGRLYIDGRLVGEAQQEPVEAWGTFGIGQAYVSGVSADFQLPFKFTGTLTEIQVELE